MSTALDYWKQTVLNQPAKAFDRTRSIYGSRLENASTNAKDRQKITTDFDELIALQKARAEKHRRSYDRFLGFLGLGIFVFISFYLAYAIGTFANI